VKTKIKGGGGDKKKIGMDPWRRTGKGADLPLSGNQTLGFVPYPGERGSAAGQKKKGNTGALSIPQ